MIELIKELNIEVSKPNVFQAVVAKQYDMNTRFIKATFVDNGDKIFINQSETVSVIINALRPDGESKAFDGVINDDGTVTVPLHSWMLELVGTVTCDISVIDIETDDNKKLTTTSFTLIVEKAAYGGDDITSDPQYDVLVQLLETCSTAGAVAEEALEKSNEANSKYDACVEATEAANEATNTLVLTHDDIVSGGYIKALKELNTGGKFSFWVGTTDEYNAITEKVNNCFYILTDDSSRNEILVTLDELEGQIGTINETLTEHAGDIAANNAIDARQDDSINQLEYRVEDLETKQNQILFDRYSTSVDEFLLEEDVGYIAFQPIVPADRYKLFAVEYIEELDLTTRTGSFLVYNTDYLTADTKEIEMSYTVGDNAGEAYSVTIKYDILTNVMSITMLTTNVSITKVWGVM